MSHLDAVAAAEVNVGNLRIKRHSIKILIELMKTSSKQIGEESFLQRNANLRGFYFGPPIEVEGIVRRINRVEQFEE